MVNVTFDAEITKDPVFERELNGIIAEFNAERSKAEKAASGRNRKLKSSPLLRLKDEGKFNAAFILSEFPKIADKTSALPSNQRDIISSIVFNAAKRTVLLKQAERARKIEEKANAKLQAEETKE